MTTTDTIHVTDWTGCYRRAWGGLLAPGAMAHPAKFSRSLLERIYDHLEDLGVRPGATILDPFGGVGCGGLVARERGHRWIGVEIEQHFVEAGRRNLAGRDGQLWAGPPATLLQGDSRRLVEVLLEYGAVVLPGSVASTMDPARAEALTGHLPHVAGGVVASPPFQDSLHDGGADSKLQTDLRRKCHGLSRSSRTRGYGVISSPPYEGTAESGSRHGENGIVGRDAAAGKVMQPFRYSDKRGGPNLGGAKREAFWTGAATVLAECAAVLPPGAPAVWVVKNFCRDGVIVRFEEQWESACNAAGFATLHRHRALLGNRKSFFRRLYEQKGGPQINHETVLCTIRMDR